MTLSAEEQNIVLSSRLFAGVSAERLPALLDSLAPRLAHYAAGATVVEAGEQVDSVGLVLAGQARSVAVGAGGGQRIVSLPEAGSFLGILLAASRNRKSPVAVVAHTPLTVIFFPAERLISPVEKAPEDHALLMRNFLDSVAEQSLALNDRISCLIAPSVREKVSSYLLRVSREKGKDGRPLREFTIPLDREAMAGYLNVERSALSRELSRMKADGLIDCRKNRFTLLGLQ